MSSRSRWTTRSSDREKTLRTMRSVTFSPAISAAFTSVQRLGRVVGVDGAEKPATGVDCSAQLERLGTAHLADDDAVGAHREHESSISVPAEWPPVECVNAERTLCAGGAAAPAALGQGEHDPRTAAPIDRTASLGASSSTASVRICRWRRLAKGPGIYISHNWADTQVGGRNEISESVLVAGGAGTRNPGAP